MGILLGHFPHQEDAFSLEDPTDTIGRVEINAGIGLVTPAQYIGDTLRQDEVVADRDAVVRNGGEAAAVDSLPVETS